MINFIVNHVFFLWTCMPTLVNVKWCVTKRMFVIVSFWLVFEHYNEWVLYNVISFSISGREFWCFIGDYVFSSIFMCFFVGFSLNVSWVFIKQTFTSYNTFRWGILEITWSPWALALGAYYFGNAPTIKHYPTLML